MGDKRHRDLRASIAAVGLKMSRHRIAELGGQAVILAVAATIFIAGLVLGGIFLLS